MACVSNINNIVNGSITYNGTRYDITALAKWVSYKSWSKSGGKNGLPVTLVIAQWGFEHGWDLADLRTTLNPAFQRSSCEYSGTYDNTRPSGNSLKEGFSAYAKLLIEGYMHVRYAYSAEGGNTKGITQPCRL